MIYFFIIIGVVILIFITISIIKPIKHKNSFESSLKEFLEKNYQENYEFQKSTNSLYNYDLKILDKKFALKIIPIPSYAEVQINNKVTWEIKYGAGATPGRAQPNKKYLSGIAGFMNYQTNEVTRVVVLIPESKQTVMYINECEIIFVTPTTNVYGIRIMNCNDFTLFKDINTKK